MQRFLDAVSREPSQNWRLHGKGGTEVLAYVFNQQGWAEYVQYLAITRDESRSQRPLYWRSSALLSFPVLVESRRAPLADGDVWEHTFITPHVAERFLEAVQAYKAAAERQGVV